MRLVEFVAKELPWNGDPEIGWWQEAKPLYLYHGSHLQNIQPIMQTGLNRPDPVTGMISLAFEPNTAYGYASMGGGEANFRAAGAKPKHVEGNQRAVIVFKFLNGLADLKALHFDTNLGGNLGKERQRLTSKAMYEQWVTAHPHDDQGYYQLAEIRIPKLVPPYHIVGYMQKR
jgi:hypothetical protein